MLQQHPSFFPPSSLLNGSDDPGQYSGGEDRDKDEILHIKARLQVEKRMASISASSATGPPVGPYTENMLKRWKDITFATMVQHKFQGIQHEKEKRLLREEIETLKSLRNLDKTTIEEMKLKLDGADDLNITLEREGNSCKGEMERLQLELKDCLDSARAKQAERIAIENGIESLSELFYFKIDLMEKRLAFAIDRIQFAISIARNFRKKGTRFMQENQILKVEVEHLKNDRKLLLDKLMTDHDRPHQLTDNNGTTTNHSHQKTFPINDFDVWTTRDRKLIDSDLDFASSANYRKPSSQSVTSSGIASNEPTSLKERVQLLDSFSSALLQAL